jgi:hypothetical protein
MGFLGIDPEVWKLLATILASLFGGGIVAYITLPAMIEKTRAEIRKTNMETAESAMTVAQQATNRAEEVMKRVTELEAVLDGELLISARFSMSEIMKNGSAPLTGTVVKIKQELTMDR